MVPPEAAERRAPPALLRALRHRNYRLFLGGQLISLIGTWMQSVAQAWLVYRLTGSSLLLGAVGFAGQIPVFLVAPFGGAVADRRDRRRVLIVTQTAAMVLALALGVLTLLHRIAVPQLFVFAAALGVVNAFDIPARQSFVVEMVGPEDLVNAIALNSSMVNGARLIGPALAGVLVGAFGEGWCFVGNGVSFVAVIAGLAAMKIAERAAPSRRASALREIGDGFRFVAKSRAIRAFLLLLGLVSLAGMPYAVLMPIFADRILGGGASGLGILMGASGAGALAGALALASRRELRGIGRWVAAASAGFGAALVAFAFSETFWLSVALLVPAGAAMMIEMAGTNTAIQTLTPNAMRGRVMAVFTMMFMGMAPFGALLAGVLADRVGPAMTVGIGGVACIAGGALFALRLPAIRKAARLIVEETPVAGQPPG